MPLVKTPPWGRRLCRAVGWASSTQQPPRLSDGHRVLVYPKPDHQPASFTILNLAVPDVGKAVAELAGRGVEFLRYDGFSQDEDGVMRGNGPDIAWFADPSGNVFSVVQE